MPANNKLVIDSGVHLLHQTTPLVTFSKVRMWSSIRMKERNGLRRIHTREFKLECCQQFATGQKRPAQICREHNSQRACY